MSEPKDEYKDLLKDPNQKSPVNIVSLANCNVFDEKGTPVRLAHLWQKQAVILIFLRHFGCISCRSHAVEIWRDREKYQKHGAKIIFIGNGAPHFINIFKEELNLQDAPIFTDPTLVSFRAAGFKRGFLVALGPRALLNGRKMFQNGHKQGAYDKNSGDLWQLGGVLAIQPSGKISYHYISQVMGDYAPEEELT